MRARTLLARSLRYYWRSNVAVVLGVAAAAAVLGGSLVVGDSVRGSLAATALARLGQTTHAVESAGYFRDALATELEAAHVDALARQIRWSGSEEGLRLERGLNFLATTGSAAPFIGLFGTVIGIINAFQSIGMTGSASLAVVAPGIAEALIATAIGLFAAIPATIFYNYFLGDLRSLNAGIDLFSAEYEGDLQRLAVARDESPRSVKA